MLRIYLVSYLREPDSLCTSNILLILSITSSPSIFSLS